MVSEGETKDASPEGLPAARRGDLCRRVRGYRQAAAGEPITLTARLAQPVMKSGEPQTNFLRIGLNGCEPQRNADRTPVNVAFAIDRSGSMSGERIAQAREAAVMAIKRPDDKDIASLVIFDDKVDVPVPAQKVVDQPGLCGDRALRADGSGVRHHAGRGARVGVVHVAYTAPDTGARQTLDAPIRARFGASDADVAAAADKIVMESVIEQTTGERAARAVVLRDQGCTEEARALLGQNAREINAYLASSPSAALSSMSRQYEGASADGRTGCVDGCALLTGARD